MLLNNQWITEERREYQKMPRNKWQWKHDHPEPMECSKRNSKNEVYSDTIWPQESRKFSNKQPNLSPKKLEEQRTNKNKVSRR